MGKVLAKVLGALSLITAVAMGFVAYSLWPWFFPPRHHFTVGSFEGTVRIGATKSELLQSSKLRVYAAGVPMVSAEQATPSQVALLMSDDVWGVDAGTVTCGNRSCPGADIHFAGQVVSSVEVTCHVCP
jgi:hypothetical protein